MKSPGKTTICPRKFQRVLAHPDAKTYIAVSSGAPCPAISMDDGDIAVSTSTKVQAIVHLNGYYYAKGTICVRLRNGLCGVDTRYFRAVCRSDLFNRDTDFFLVDHLFDESKIIAHKRTAQLRVNWLGQTAEKTVE